jgi:putative lipoic acid-binding regulatory protein
MMNVLHNTDVVEYPVRFPIKIICFNRRCFEDIQSELVLVFKILDIPNENWRHKLSRNDTYISFTAEVEVKSKDQLERLYEMLADVEHTKMVL